jgi:hypothetical protein
MPRVSYFFGISIYMYFDDHLPPHFHAVYNEYKAAVSIETLEVLKGEVPGRVLALVLEWASIHRGALLRNWEALRSGRPFDKIEPLR